MLLLLLWLLLVLALLVLPPRILLWLISIPIVAVILRTVAWNAEQCASGVQSHLIRHVFHYQMYKQISTFAVMTGNERPFTRRIVSQTFRSSARSSNATSMGDNEQKIRDGGEGGRRRVGGERWSEWEREWEREREREREMHCLLIILHT